MKIRFAILFAALVLIFTCSAEPASSDQARRLFYRGNAYYNDGDFDNAITYYEDALHTGLESGPLHYNLGNAYFKKGSLGKAIVEYIRAKRLTPQDADLLSNLAFARSLIKAEVTAPQRNFFIRLFFSLAGSLSLDTITLFSCFIYFLLAALAIALILVPRLRRALFYPSIVLLTVLAVSLSLFYIQYNATIAQKEAIIITETSDAKFEPFRDATTFFTLYEGQNVVVVTSEEDWIKIKRPDGKQGWIKASDLETI